MEEDVEGRGVGEEIDVEVKEEEIRGKRREGEWEVTEVLGKDGNEGEGEEEGEEEEKVKVEVRAVSLEEEVTEEMSWSSRLN